MDPSTTYTTFDGATRIASGDLRANQLAAKRALEASPHGQVLSFEDRSGRQVDLDLREQPALPAPSSPDPAPAPRGRGRPRLGVVAREVTLLPRHWEWLESQPGGASTTLRRLVEEARLAGAKRELARHAQERAYRVMTALAGNLPGYEEASRALFAGYRELFEEHIAAWPADVRDYVLRLASTDKEDTP